jgi:antitoxin CcdA
MGTKRAVNLSLDSDLLDEAKSYGMNLSKTVEAVLSNALREERERRWQEENRKALEDFDRYIDEHGVFGSEWRSL